MAEIEELNQLNICSTWPGSFTVAPNSRQHSMPSCHFVEEAARATAFIPYTVAQGETYFKTASKDSLENFEVFRMPFFDLGSFHPAISQGLKGMVEAAGFSTEFC